MAEGVPWRVACGEPRGDGDVVAVEWVEPPGGRQGLHDLATPATRRCAGDELIPVVDTEANGCLREERRRVGGEPADVIDVQVAADDHVDVGRAHPDRVEGGGELAPVGPF